MKKLFLFLLFLGFVFGGSFAASRYLDTRSVLPVKQMAESGFQPTPFTLKNHPFTLVIVGTNNGATVTKTLGSVFAQNYENYKVVYIDDASDDGSFDLARELIYNSDHLFQVTLVQNEKRLGVLANIFRAVQTCANDEIVVILEGEDWLAHEWVLQRLNAYYADPDLWITYGQYCEYPTYQKGACQEYNSSRFRSEPFIASHLKTFYAGLFKKVHESDFVFSGKFLPACADLAYMIPMLEMAKDHFQFIPEVLYICNRQAGYQEDRDLQARCEKFIRTLDPYPPLKVNPCGE